MAELLEECTKNLIKNKLKAELTNRGLVSNTRNKIGFANQPIKSNARH